MHINKIITSFLIVFFGWLLCLNVYAQSGAVQSDPVALLQYIANNMINSLKANQATLKTKPGIVYSLADKYVVPYADLPAMSQRVLPPSTWNNASAAQRSQFQREFTRLLIRTYASALSSYQDQTVQFYPVRGGTEGVNTVEVSSEILSSSHDPIHVTYRLLHVGGVWRLYDMSVEGVSLIESFRSQFADILSSGSMDQLLNRLSQHNTGAGRG